MRFNLLLTTGYCSKTFAAKAKYHHIYTRKKLLKAVICLLRIEIYRTKNNMMEQITLESCLKMGASSVVYTRS